MSTITCISLHQPFASLVASRLKPHETRHWAFPERLAGQRIAIHAAARPIKSLEHGRPLRDVCRHTFGPHWEHMLPLGAVVCTAILHSQAHTENVTPVGIVDRLAGDWTSGRWAWLLRDVQRLELPLPMRGHQAWWSVPLADLDIAA